MTSNNNSKNLGTILKQQRVMRGLTLRDVSTMSGVSSSHLGRIERGGRFPSASVLRKIAKPLGFEEDKLLTLADYLSPQASTTESERDVGQLDSYVARVLSQEPVEVQRIVIGLLAILKSLTKNVARQNF